jgi:hypothetical protein
MISRVWGVSGIHGLLALPKRAKHNTDYFTKTVIANQQTNICKSGRRKALKGIRLYLGNAPVQNF